MPETETVSGTNGEIENQAKKAYDGSKKLVEEAAADAKKTLGTVVNEAVSSVDQVKYGNLSLTLKLAIIFKSIPLTGKIAEKVKESLKQTVNPGGKEITGGQSSDMLDELISFVWNDMEAKSNIIEKIKEVEGDRAEEEFREILNYWATGPANDKIVRPNISD